MDAISTGAPRGRAKKLVPPPVPVRIEITKGRGHTPPRQKKQEHIYIKKSTGIMTSSIHNI